MVKKSPGPGFRPPGATGRPTRRPRIKDAGGIPIPLALPGRWLSQHGPKFDEPILILRRESAEDVENGPVPRSQSLGTSIEKIGRIAAETLGDAVNPNIAEAHLAALDLNDGGYPATNLPGQRLARQAGGLATVPDEIPIVLHDPDCFPIRVTGP